MTRTSWAGPSGRPSGWRLFFMVVLAYLGAQAAAAVALWVMLGMPTSLGSLGALSSLAQNGRTVAVPSAIGELAIFGFAWLVIHRRMSLSSAGLDGPRLIYLADGLGLFVLILLCSIVFGLLLHTGDVRSQLDLAGELHAWWEGPLIALSAGFAEEITFRGYLLQGLRRIWPHATWAAVLVSSVAFGLAHLAWGLNPLQFVFYIVLGVLFALVVLQRRSVWPAIWAHAGWDALAFLLLLLKVK